MREIKIRATEKEIADLVKALQGLHAAESEDDPAVVDYLKSDYLEVTMNEKRTPMNGAPMLDDEGDKTHDRRDHLEDKVCDLEKEVKRLRRILRFPTYFTIGQVIGLICRLLGCHPFP